MVAITKELCCGFGDFLVGRLVCFVGFWGDFFAAEKNAFSMSVFSQTETLPKQ